MVMPAPPVALDSPVRKVERKQAREATMRAVQQDAAARARTGLPTRRLNLFENLSDSECSLLLARCTERNIAAGSTVFAQAGSHTATFLVKSGLVRTYYCSPTGKEITVAYWSAGDIVGGPHFFDDYGVHVWTGDAVENSVVLAIKGRDLRELSARIPAIAECVIDSLSFKLHWVSLLLQTRCTESVCHRLANMLVRLSEMYGVECEDGILIRYPFTQEDLANMVGATRQWVNMTFGQFQRDGFVRIKKRRLVILDVARLRRMTTESAASPVKKRKPVQVSKL